MTAAANPPRRLRVVLTIDLEHDCPPYLSGYRGMEEGAPRFLDLLRREGVPATCFATGDVARRYPALIRELAAAGHELGCHGDTHRRFGGMTATEATAEIETATATLRALAPVTSFRAPNLDFPFGFLPLLAERGYTVDSSLAAYKVHKGHPRRPLLAGGLLRVPVATTPSAIRLPRLPRQFILRQQRDPVVLFFHPWEFVDLTRAAIPLDCRFRTGPAALTTLGAAIAFLRQRGAEFTTLRALHNSFTSFGAA
jgi:peptidoglycan/xylan/chitin deacetylase (PgdA/CDA1 family)